MTWWFGGERQVLDSGEPTAEELARYDIEQMMRRFEEPDPGILVDDPPLEFPVVLKKQNVEASNHLDLDLSDGITLQVRDVTEGPVTEWNRKFGTAIHRDIRIFDRIYEVNGVQGDAQELFQAMKATRLELLVRRPVTFTATMMRSKNQFFGMGLETMSHPDTAGEMQEWLLVKWSQHHSSIAGYFNTVNWETPIRKGDRILQVNEEADLIAMQKIFESRNAMKIEVLFEH